MCEGAYLHQQRFKLFCNQKPLFLARWHNDDLHNYFTKTFNSSMFNIVYFDGLGISPYIEYFKDIPTVISTSDGVSLTYANAASASSNFFKKIYQIYASKMIGHFEKDILPLFTRVHVVSKEDQDYYQSVHNIAHVETIEHVVPDDVFRYNGINISSESEAMRIVFTGNLGFNSIQKGLQSFLAEVYPNICLAIPNIELIILGQNAPDSFQKKIRKLSNVTIINWVDDYYAELKKADVIIFTDWTGTGVKTRVLIALGLGKAIVATPAALQGIQANDGKHCFKREVGPQFTDALLQLLNNTDLRRTIEYNARKLILDQYNMEVIGKKWLQFFESAINKWRS